MLREQARRRRSLATLAALGLAIAALPAFAWPKVPLPPGASGEMVSSNMLYNGVPMRASKITVPMELDKVVEFYRDVWTGNVVADRMNGKVIVGHFEGTYYITVELSGRGTRTEGTIGIMEIPDKPVDMALGKGFDKPANTEVVSDIRYLDTSSNARTIAMKNRMSPYMNMRYYVQRMPARGWKQEQGSEPCRASSNACVLNFTGSSGARLSLTLTREQAPETAIVVSID